jgi:hypothetical protein
VPEAQPAQPAALPGGVAVTAQEPAAPTTITTVDVRRPVVSTTEYVRLPWLSVAADPGVTGRIQQRIDGLEQSARIAPALYPNEHVRLVLTRGALEGDTLLVVRPGRRVGTQGTIIEPVAMVRVESVDAGGAVARIVNQFGDARVGDVVMPMRSAPEPDVRRTGTRGWRPGGSDPGVPGPPVHVRHDGPGVHLAGPGAAASGSVTSSQCMYLRAPAHRRRTVACCAWCTWTKALRRPV